MVIARYTTRQPNPKEAAPGGPTESSELFWKALRLASVCAACAFTFFFLSQRNLFQRSGQNLGALSDSVERVNFHVPDGKSVSASTSTSALSTQPTFAVPDDPNIAGVFTLSVGSDFQDVPNNVDEDLELKLSGVNATAHTYDITIRTSNREFYQQDVPLNEHIPLLKDSPNGPTLVVSGIAENQVIGYLTEPQRRGHRRHRRHY
jgi:hypothetical protein